MMFYSAVVLFSVFAILFLVWPIVARHFSRTSNDQHKSDELAQRESANIALYRDHLGELDVSLEQGSIDNDQYQQLKTELERNLLEDSRTAVGESAATVAAPGRWLLWLAAVVLPISAAGLYMSLGAYSDWQLNNVLLEKQQLELQWSENVLQHNGDQRENIEASLGVKSNELVAALKEQLAGSPDNVQSWVLLARTSVELQDYDSAISSYQQILRREPQSSQIMAEMAQVIFSQAGNKIVPVVSSLVAQALSIDPDNGIALGLAGIEAFQGENFKQAITHWRLALRGLDPNGNSARALQNGITQAEARLVIAPNKGATAANSAVPMVKDSSRTTTEPTNSGKVALSIDVSLGEQVEFKPDHAVFIYARAWQGPKMPLAIVKLRADQLPTTVTLDETMAMMPSMTLASFEQVELVARLSASGGPVPKPGDWEGLLGPIPTSIATSATTASAQPHTLVITQPITQ